MKETTFILENNTT